MRGLKDISYKHSNAIYRISLQVEVENFFSIGVLLPHQFLVKHLREVQNSFCEVFTARVVFFDNSTKCNRPSPFTWPSFVLCTRSSVWGDRRMAKSDHQSPFVELSKKTTLFTAIEPTMHRWPIYIGSNKKTRNSADSNRHRQEISAYDLQRVKDTHKGILGFKEHAPSRSSWTLPLTDEAS